VRWLKPYKLEGALDRLKKVSETIEHLGKTMKIQISTPYYQLRVRELELTADFLQKQAEQKEAERVERERLRQERKAQQELEFERARLAKERQHHANALQVLVAKGDEAGAARLRDQLAEVDRAIESVDDRAANIRAGYVYLISNIGSFGERMVKLGLTWIEFMCLVTLWCRSTLTFTPGFSPKMRLALKKPCTTAWRICA